jgi:hypothetical protein
LIACEDAGGAACELVSLLACEELPALLVAD